jgi:hypothetical protein
MANQGEASASTLTGGMMPTSQVNMQDQRAGILQQLRSIETQLTEGKNSLLTIAGQFPASSEDARSAIQGLEAARSKLIGLLTTILSQTTEPGPVAPRISG